MAPLLWAPQLLALVTTGVAEMAALTPTVAEAVALPPPEQVTVTVYVPGAMLMREAEVDMSFQRKVGAVQLETDTLIVPLAELAHEFVVEMLGTGADTTGKNT